MPKICYVAKTFNTEHREIIDTANAILEEYAEQGYTLTLRQLYYQFVARDIIPNTVQSYGRLGKIINDARLAGEIDWDAIEDRNRSITEHSHWRDPAHIIEVSAQTFAIDKWLDQPLRVVVLVEKDALAGVFETTTYKWDVPLLACKGYLSASAVYDLAKRVVNWRRTQKQDVCVLHFGDHDPSGIDMTRDIRERLGLLSTYDFSFKSFTTGKLRKYKATGATALERLALNYDQIEQYDPPPNPAKTTDARYASYEDKFGTTSWELDALSPQVLNGILESRITDLIDKKRWNDAVAREDEMRRALQTVSNRWDSVLSYLNIE